MLRQIVKQSCYGIATVLVAPLAGTELLARSILRRDVFFQTHNELLSITPGKLGSFFRNAYLHLTLRRCPLHCYLSFGAVFTHSAAELGHRVYLGAHCIIGLATIGDDTMLADNVCIPSGANQHGTSDPSMRFQEQPGTFACIHVGSNCWLGTSSTIMADIGDNCIIGAGSVVTRPIPSNSVAVGNPARVIRATFPDLTSEAIPSEQPSITSD
jgi:virginiamycin A acetyltransferase